MSELYRQAYFESSVAIKTTRIQDDDCLLVQGVLTGTLRDKTIKMFSVLFSGLCACWPAESLGQSQTDGPQEASGSGPADCHSWLGEQGLCPPYPQRPPAPSYLCWDRDHSSK